MGRLKPVVSCATQKNENFKKKTRNMRNASHTQRLACAKHLTKHTSLRQKTNYLLVVMLKGVLYRQVHTKMLMNMTILMIRNNH